MLRTLRTITATSKRAQSFGVPFRVYAALNGSKNGPPEGGTPNKASVHDHTSDALALVHQIKSFVDVREGQRMGDHRVDLDLTLHIPVDNFRYVGAPARTAEGRPLPNAAGNQLEGT